jgi:prepilin-type N-terminal cleavage/methylation domain-containing protein
MRKNRARGFTLIEVLVALVITVSALVLLAQGFAVGGSASSSAQKTTRAVMLASKVMAQYETGELGLSASGQGDFKPDYPGFTWKSDMATSTNNLTQVTVTVAWTQGQSEQSYALVRLMRERPTP